MTGQFLLARLSRRVWTIILASVLFLGLLYWLAPAQTLLPVLAGDGSHQVLEIEGLAIGEPFSPSTDYGSSSLIAALKERYDQPQYPHCTLNSARYAETIVNHGSKGSSTVGIVINLHDSQDIIPALSIAVLQAASILLRRNKVYLSIYDNDPKDESRALLAHFIAAAQAIGFEGIWVTSSHMTTPADEDRIVLISEFRNNALRPILAHLSASSSKASTTLVFVNDVVTCASDILELVHQKRLQQADMVFGLDWGAFAGPPGSDAAVARLYDMWVARGLNGDLFYPWEGNHGLHPLNPSGDWVRDILSTQSSEVHHRWLAGQPLPAYSGWGGMAAFEGSLFLKDHLRFRSSIKSAWRSGNNPALGAWGKLVSNEAYLDSDCPGASECEYICRDIWNLRKGKARIVLAPQARTAYSNKDWELVQDLIPASRRSGPENDELVSWAEVRPPSSVECVPTRDAHGDPVVTWDDTNERTRLDPIWSSSWS